MTPSSLFAVLAIVGGTVHTADGPPIENATLIIDGDRITAVGTGLAVPKDAQIIDAKGKLITPGFIDAFTTLGLVEIDLVPASNDIDAGVAFPPIRAAYQAVDSYNPGSIVIPIQRAHGVTTVVSAPQGGIVAGTAGLFDLIDDEPVVKAQAAVVVHLGGDQLGGRGARLLRLREVLEDARAYSLDRKAFEQNRFRPTPASRLDLEALIPVVKKQVPLLITAARKSDLLAALELARVQDVRVVLADAAEAWMAVEALAAAKVPVIVDPSQNLPITLDHVHARAETAALLAGAGVPVILSTFSAHNVRKLRQWAGNAVRAGLPPDAALRAITATPAAAFDLGDRGTIAAGKIANVVVWSGDPFELSSRAEQVIIRGRPMDRGHRQQALFERYRTVPPKLAP